MATAERTFYQILGVETTADASEIRVAYLNLARALHPDQIQAASDAEKALAERRMREINAAYEVLNDPESKVAYDRASTPSRPASPPPPPNPTPTRPQSYAPPQHAAVDQSEPEPFDELDDEEITPAVAFLLHRGPIIAAIVIAAMLFIVTAYAGGSKDEPTPTPGTCVEQPSSTTAVELVAAEAC